MEHLIFINIFITLSVKHISSLYVFKLPKVLLWLCSDFFVNIIGCSVGPFTLQGDLSLIWVLIFISLSQLSLCKKSFTSVNTSFESCLPVGKIEEIIFF